jgi:hypothetical protein
VATPPELVTLTSTQRFGTAFCNVTLTWQNPVLRLNSSISTSTEPGNGVLVGIEVAISVAVAVLVGGTAVLVALSVAVLVGGTGVLVGVEVPVAVLVAVAVFVGVAVSVGVGVSVGVAVAVCGGGGPPTQVTTTLAWVEGSEDQPTLT